MEKQDKIKAIYEKIAKKDLTFGCKIENHKSKSQKLIFIDDFGDYNTYDVLTGIMFCTEKYKNVIIGHPVMIGDCINYICNNSINYELSNKSIILLTDYWGNEGDLTKPLEMQVDECIDYIYDLIKQYGGHNNV